MRTQKLGAEEREGGRKNLRKAEKKVSSSKSSIKMIQSETKDEKKQPLCASNVNDCETNKNKLCACILKGISESHFELTFFYDFFSFSLSALRCRNGKRK